MKNPFRSIELQLESLFEGTTGLFSKRTGLMARILSGILRALEEQSHPGPGDVWLAPNRFSVRLGKKVWSALDSPKETARILEQKIQDHLRQSEMVVTAPLYIRLALEEGVRPESIRVDADFTDTEGARTDPHLSPPGTPAVLPLNAFLIVNGHTHFPLGRPIINIGRNLENHLVLDDVMVSRRHAQLRARDGRYLLTDLGSKHGTRVNNRIVEDEALIPGDVIRIGTTELIYGDDSIDQKTVPLTKTRSEHGAKP